MCQHTFSKEYPCDIHPILTQKDIIVTFINKASRPDITYAVGSLANLTSKLTNLHWITLKCVLCYLKGTIDYEIQYKKGESDDCVGFSDTDWAGDTDDWKSTSGYMFKMSGGAIA